MYKSFETPGPISLYVEIGGGDVKVHASEVTETTIDVDGPDAEDVTVEQRGGQVVVIAPKRTTGFFNRDSDLSVTATVPLESELVTKVGSADLVATGRYGKARVKAGSGEVRISELMDEALIDTGSGDVTIDEARGDLRVKCGSGEVRIDRAAGKTSVSTGSGDVYLGVTESATEVKSGSGEIRVKEAHTDLAMTTASGDLHVDTFQRGGLRAKGVSGDVWVGIPAGIPVWTDVSCLSGKVTSTLEGAGQPEDGQEFIELRATTVSGDIHLEQL